MKRTFGIAIKCFLVTVAFVLTSVSSSRTASAQCEVMKPPPGNPGTDFLLCFEQNDVAQHGPFDSAACYVYMASTSDQVDTVTITCLRYPSMNQQFVLPPHGSTSWKITDNYPDIWITTRDSSINNRVVRVHSSGPSPGNGNIVCYGLNYVLNTADAFLALPKTSSGADYRIMSYTNSAYIVSPMPSQFCVAAFDDNTVVHITPAANTLTDDQTKTGHAAGQTFTVTLKGGECIQVQTDPTLVDGARPE